MPRNTIYRPSNSDGCPTLDGKYHRHPACGSKEQMSPLAPKVEQASLPVQLSGDRRRARLPATGLNTAAGSQDTAGPQAGSDYAESSSDRADSTKASSDRRLCYITLPDVSAVVACSRGKAIVHRRSQRTRRTNFSGAGTPLPWNTFETFVIFCVSLLRTFDCALPSTLTATRNSEPGARNPGLGTRIAPRHVTQAEFLRYLYASSSF